MKKPIILLVSLLLLMTSCKRNPLKIDVSEVPVEIEFKRFEADLFNLSLDSLDHALPRLEEQYGTFLTLFGYLINIGEPENPLYTDFLRAFVTDRVNYEAYQETMRVFPDLNGLKEDIIRAFQYYHYHFPGKDIPDLYTFISGFNASILVDTSILAIGLDRYLGSNYETYERMGIPNYVRINMVPDKILSDCVFAWGSTEFTMEGETGQEVSDNVLNNMLFEGKLRYFVKAMIPDEPDHLIMGFSPEQMQWCQENEAAMWTYLVENKLLFNTDHLTIRKLTGEAPFTSFFPKESPGKAAVWLGWQIIENYVERHPGTTLEELMANVGYQDILNGARYNPE
jgi:hypothetical protein